ncbi:hypothetical protein GCM10012280_58100 [Wenjunlia tyrosinilytica]|uniref:Uncharacterized protein n=1 Tax=Wenjunlia tyrosinilytica TaxID=1544741 RepID=A0A917ZYC0_9ACTN|nr:hypothetical protein GCM10012280_58100 [Wenjunlia tyrosinilytica]
MPAYPLPSSREDTVIQRVLVRHGISHDKIMLLADGIRTAVARLMPGTPREAGRPGFHH